MFIRNIGVWERSIFDVDCFPHKHHRLNIDNIIIIVNMTITLTMFFVVVIIIIYRLNENVCWCCCCWCWVGWCCFFFVSTELVFYYAKTILHKSSIVIHLYTLLPAELYSANNCSSNKNNIAIICPPPMLKMFVQYATEIL